MCFSAQASISVFIFVVLLSTFNIIYFRDKQNIILMSIFALYVGLVQLVEYLIWTNKAVDKNHIYGLINMFLHITQPIVLYLLFIGFTDTEQSLKTTATVIIFLYITYLMYTLSSKDFSDIQVGVDCKQGHLSNPWWGNDYLNAIPYFISFFLIILLLIRPMQLAYMLVALMVFTILIAGLLTFRNGGSFPSVWCFTAVLLPVFISWYGFYF